jgi:RluA family pseudouridine synthase
MNLSKETILFHQDHLIVVNKPSNLPSTGRTLKDPDCLQYQLISQEKQMVWAIHQLDADTSGVNLFTTDKMMVKLYKEALQQTHSKKIYLAIIHGSPNWRTIDEKSPIGKIDTKNLGVTVTGKPAHSHFKVLSQTANHSLIQAQIFSGRTHQIRIHLAHLGFPLVGEEWYRTPPCKLHPRQALHCYEINLLTIKQRFKVPLSKDLHQLLNKLKLTLPRAFTSELNGARTS